MVNNASTSRLHGVRRGYHRPLPASVRRRVTLRRLACLSVGCVALAIPAVASAAGGTNTSITGSAKATNGYVVHWSISTQKLGSKPVTFSVVLLKGGGTLGKVGWWQLIHTYTFKLSKRSLKFDRKFKRGSFKASLGKYGKVKIRFTGKGRNRITKPATTCTGPNTQSRKLRVSGSIRFSPSGLGKVGTLTRKATGSRYTSNKPFNCPPGNNTTCAIQNGRESFSSVALGAYFLAFSASHAKVGGVVSENVSETEPLTKPGTTINRSLFVVGTASVLSEAGTAPGVVAVTGAGHGITGSMTLTAPLTSQAEAAPCAAFTVDRISGFGSPAVQGSLMANFFDDYETIDPTKGSVSTSWSRDHSP
jgi:hypothetical protein